MGRSEHFAFSHTRKIEISHRFAAQAHDAGVILNTSRSANGRYLSLDGERLLNFGSCSYMALETRPELRESAHRALDEFGTQFHFSRVFLQCPLYEELEALLAQITGRSVVVAPSTSVAHMSALPVLIGDGDQIVIDQFAHASLHTAVQLLPKVPLHILRHNRMDELDALLTRQGKGSGKVWYIADGLYSMLGDFAPFAELSQLLDRHDQLRLYIDDAHSTSWLGRHGRGIALDHFADDERVVVALSLNKAFSAAGGVLALPQQGDLARRIRRCGGPMLFSGPIQPPMLGAAVGSARLHLSDEFAGLQAELNARIALCGQAVQAAKLSLVTATETPIFQTQCDSPRVVFRVAELMKAKGFFCCVCVFPAVPMNRPGIRFTVSRHNDLADIEPFVQALVSATAQAAGEISRARAQPVSAPECEA
jgi:7-keto-8-aminopelargonate synthetase-like enzyme